MDRVVLIQQRTYMCYCYWTKWRCKIQVLLMKVPAIKRLCVVREQEGG